LNQIDDVRLTTEIEPSVLAMSDIYIAVGFNNRALYYRIQSVEGLRNLICLNLMQNIFV